MLVLLQASMTTHLQVVGFYFLEEVRFHGPIREDGIVAGLTREEERDQHEERKRVRDGC